LNMADDVRNPAVVRVEISRGVKAVPGIVVEVGLAFIKDIYLATLVSLIDILLLRRGLTL
jgi:hypothetical protein